MKKINTKNTYTNSFGDTYFTEINDKAFDNIGATATFNKVFSKVFNSESTLSIVVGSDSGLLIPYLKNHQAGKSRKYIILEKPEMISYIENNYDFDEKLIEILPFDATFEDIAQDYTDYISHNRHSLIRSLAVIDSSSDVYQEIWQDVLDRFNIFSSSQSGFATNHIFVDSQIQNIAVNQIPLNRISKSLKGLTSIIMGGGPSLDENIVWVRENQDKLVIFAAARIAERLKKENIAPDFFVSVDPHDVSYDNSKTILINSGDAILINSNNVNSKLVAEWPGLKSYIGLKFPWTDSKRPEENNLKVVGPTVTNTMVSVASYISSSQVILSGVDFCSSKDGSSHESGSVESKIGKFVFDTANRVETYSGRIAETTAVFASARNAMQDLVSYLKNNFKTDFYNISQESAKIENIPYSLAKDIKLSKQNKQQAINEIKQQLQFNLKDYKIQLSYAKSYLQDMRDLCKDVVTQSNQGKKITKQLFINEDKTSKLINEVIKIKKKLVKTMGEHDEFIFDYSVKSYKDLMDPSVDQENMTNDDVKNSFIHYFDGLKNSAIPLRKSIEKGLDKLNHRINETKGTKQLPKLIDSWKKHHENGRPIVWFKMNGFELNSVPAEYEEEIKSLLETFDKELKKTDTKLKERLEKRGDSTKSNFERIQRYFEDGKLDELEELVQYIADKDSSNANDLCKLGLGYLHELKEQPEIALTHYVQIEDNKMLMEGLKRVVNITISQEDYNSALNALEVLVNYSDEYYISYAGILAAMGDISGAIEIYLHYLQSHEDDIGTWVKLAKLLIHNGIMDEAVNAINKIKELDPESTVVDKLMSLATKNN